MEFLTQLVISGLAIGSIYAVVAVGFSLTFATSQTVNFSQGQSVMLGAVLFYSFYYEFNFSPLVSAIAVLFLGLLFGIAIAYAAIFPFTDSKSSHQSSGWLLSTIAVGIVVENIALLMFGRETRALLSPFGEQPIVIFGVGAYPHEIFLIVAGLILALFTDMFINRSKIGAIYRAVSSNSRGAELIGINTKQVLYTSYAISSGMAFMAGILVAPVLNVSASMGTVIGIKAFAVAAVAGMVWPRGIVLVGLCYGVVETLVAGYFGSGIREILGFSLLILILSIFPLGLFAKPQGRQV